VSRRIALTGQFTLALASAAVVVWALARWLPAAYDWHMFFRPAVLGWLQGESPYAIEVGFPNPPWLLLGLLPFALPPEPVGRALLVIFTITVFVLALQPIRRRRLASLLTLLSFPFLTSLWNGQMEAFPMFGVIVGYWAAQTRRPWAFSLGLLLMATKPQETGLVILLMLWSARRWHWKEWARMMALPAIALILSLAVFRLDWLRILYATGDEMPRTWVNISWVWRVIAPLWLWLALAYSMGVVALALVLTLRRPLSRYTVALMVVASVLASPYVATHHLVLPMALAWPWLLDRKPWLAALVYLTSLTPLARLSGDQSVNWLDFIFPVALAAALLFFYREQSPGQEPKDN
jgi:hypothetical protein